MKKTSFKLLQLKKRSISKLTATNIIKGGISGYHYTCSSQECAETEHNPSEEPTVLIICYGTTLLTYGQETCADSE